MPGYGQFCPVAKAMEVLDQRWTLLVVRELLMGSTRFNELRRGVPRMSPGLLSRRLSQLERAGLVSRSTEGGHPAYTLTEGGRALLDVVNSLGRWGLRWMPDLGDADLDPHLLMWDIRRTLPAAAWPPGRTVVAVHFTDVHAGHARWWVVVTDGEVDICDTDPGHEVTAGIASGLGTLTRVWRGEVTWAEALRDGRVRLDGPRSTTRLIPGWFGSSTMASLAATPIA